MWKAFALHAKEKSIHTAPDPSFPSRCERFVTQGEPNRHETVWSRNARSLTIASHNQRRHQ